MIKRIALTLGLLMATATAQAADGGIITCYKPNGTEAALVNGLSLLNARFLDFDISSDGYYRVRLAQTNKLYLLPIENCFITLD